MDGNIKQGKSKKTYASLRNTVFIRRYDSLALFWLYDIRFKESNWPNKLHFAQNGSMRKPVDNGNRK